MSADGPTEPRRKAENNAYRLPVPQARVLVLVRQCLSRPLHQPGFLPERDTANLSPLHEGIPQSATRKFWPGRQNRLAAREIHSQRPFAIAALAERDQKLSSG